MMASWDNLRLFSNCALLWTELWGSPVGQGLLSGLISWENLTKT